MGMGRNELIFRYLFVYMELRHFPSWRRAGIVAPLAGRGKSGNRTALSIRVFFRESCQPDRMPLAW